MQKETGSDTHVSARQTLKRNSGKLKVMFDWAQGQWSYRRNDRMEYGV